MFRHALLSVVAFACLSCTTNEKRPLAVTARELHTAYTLDDDGRWDKQTIRVLLTAGSYQTEPDCLTWRTDRTTDAPDIRFYTTQFPPDTNHSIMVQGTVQGRLWDWSKRTNGLSWYIHVGGCQVMPAP